MFIPIDPNRNVKFAINENIPKVTTIIFGGMLILFSWIFPFITMLPIKTMLFYEKNTLAFGSSFHSYLLCTLAFVLFGFSLILIFSKKALIKIISIILCLSGILLFYISTNEYYLLKSNGLYIKSLAQTGKSTYLQWNDINQVTYVYNEGRTRNKRVEIELKNGDMKIIDFNGYTLQMRPYIDHEIITRGGQVKNIEETN